MSSIDWAVLVMTLVTITAYGVYKSRKQKNLQDYLLDSNSAKWWTVGLSVMATQASAITFLSTPGQAYSDGMRFVQFYFGLPIAIVIICITFIPRYKKMKVFTAYEYLENRFGVNTRLLTAILFLVQRGLAAGITIYAPAIVLSSVLGVSLHSMVLLIGGLVVIYTVLGGTKAVNITQTYQMAIIFLGLFIAFYIVLDSLPDGMTFTKSLEYAGAAGKMNLIDLSWDLNDRYTLWTGLIGGSFLALSYFGTDQSQVQRYLTAENVNQSRYGLLFNAVFKVPMQFFILLVGIMVFVFYQHQSSPIFFNQSAISQIENTEYSSEYQTINAEWQQHQSQRQQLLDQYIATGKNEELTSAIATSYTKEKALRDDMKSLIKKALPEVESNDKDYVFIHFILHQLPKGLIGLLLAVFFCAAMSSTASELNALASTSLVDIYKRLCAPDATDQHYVFSAKMLTVFWGLVAISFASVASLFDNLIQLVNIIGSLFYGTILGVFLVAFYLKRVRGKAVFIAAIISEILVIYIFSQDWVAYLWLNVIGCVLVVIISLVLNELMPEKEEDHNTLKVA